MDNVIFKGYRDKLTVLFNDVRNFEQLKNDFSAKLKSSQKFFDGTQKSYIEFKGCELTDNQKSDQ